LGHAMLKTGEDKYVKRYEEISDRIEKAADEIE
jgi:hypothetical protein